MVIKKQTFQYIEMHHHYSVGRLCDLLVDCTLNRRNDHGEFVSQFRYCLPISLH